MFFAEYWFCLLRPDPDDQLRANDTAAHVAIEQEANPPEHLPLGEILPSAKLMSDSVCQDRVKCHVASIVCEFEGALPDGPLLGVGAMFHGYDYISLFLSPVGVPVSFNDVFKRVASEHLWPWRRCRQFLW
jgi:hypothetical protein